MTVKKNRLTPVEYDEISLVDSGAAQLADVLIFKRASCDPPNKTGKKDGKSTRSKNWKEERHPRDEKGKMKQSSSESKAKHGKGGTTQAKLDAECRSKKKGGKKQQLKNRLEQMKSKGGMLGPGGRPAPGAKKKRRKRGPGPGGRPLTVTKNLTKSAMISWDKDAQLRATLERKAT